jgi:hypothetical protein
VVKECDLDEAECRAGHLPAGAGEQEQHVSHNHLSQVLDNTEILNTLLEVLNNLWGP